MEATRERAWEPLTKYTQREALRRHALAVEASTAWYARHFDEDEEFWEAVLSHAEHLGMPRDTPLKKALFACDELSGFVHACGLVRPTGIAGLEPKSVKKKLKQPSFAAGVHREEVYAGAEGLGLDLDDHIRNVVEAMQPIAPELGLRTADTADTT
ncbi:MAG: HAD family hydrolase [Actinobacteria bacterium]|nr:MAG: HAD family hydrolase [Actinomycetota bacterium]